MSSYSLDSKENITISENESLTGLPNGLHNITLYANDTFGNVATSQTNNFTIAKPQQTFPTAIVITASGAAAVVATGLLVYFEKYKR